LLTLTAFFREIMEKLQPTIHQAAPSRGRLTTPTGHVIRWDFSSTVLH